MFLFSLMLATQVAWQAAVVSSAVTVPPAVAAPPAAAVPAAATPPAVVAPDDVQEFERLIRPRLSDGSWKRFSGAADLVDGQVVFTFGLKAARQTRLPERRVVEFFVMGSTPLVEGHVIVPWEAPVAAHLFLLRRFAAGRGSVPFCVLSTPRTRDWAGRLVSGSAGLVTSQEVNDPAGALKVAADLLAGRIRCAGVLLTGDFEVLDWTALEVFIPLQTRLGIPVFGRTRHEVLLGAAAAVEPRYESWEPLAQQAPTAQIFYHKHISEWFGVEEIISPEWNPQPLAR